MLRINPAEIRDISRQIRDISGISLDQSKAYLIETRLGRIAEELHCASYSELFLKLKSDTTRSIERRVVDSITTNETQFFRDTSPFELLRGKILPDLIYRRTSQSSGAFPKPIRIWGAACSTGQEVYSVAIVLKELSINSNKIDTKIVGTDLSDAAITRASYAQYNKFEVERGLSQDRLQKYFTNNGTGWRIKDEVRAMVTFRKQNLMEPFDGLGRFDIIFCRNVAIYFAPEDRSKLFSKIADALEPDGYLLIGSSESLTAVCDRFEPKMDMRSVYYQLRK